MVAGVEAWRWVTMSLGCEAAWHARQELLTLFSSRGTLPSQGLPASSEETLAGREGGGGGQGRGWQGGKGAGGSWGPPLRFLMQPQHPPQLLQRFGI